MKEFGKYIRRCFELALRGGGRVSPNPLVGSVIVKNGKVIAEGWHARFGGPHAEAEAIINAVESVEGGDLYCNLEPCSHTDKQTPPCVPLIIRNKIRRVIISNQDPNPKVSGRGIKELRSGGIEVIEGIETEMGRHLNRFYFKSVEEGIPYVTLKIARTIDNKISAGERKRTIITGIESEEFVHELRSKYDAVLVGANTVIKDDPLLNVRRVEGRAPARIILDADLAVPIEARLFGDKKPPTTLLFTSLGSDPGKRGILRKMGVKIRELPAGTNRRLELKKILSILKDYKIISLLVEGGADVFTQFLDEDLTDELILLQSAKILGKGLESMNPKSEMKFKLFDSARLGEDIKMIYLREKES